MNIFHELFLFFPFFWSPRGFLQSTVWPHEMALERVASHINVTCPCPPCLFRLPPWVNVNHSTTLINSTRVWSSSSHQLFMREIASFHQLEVPFLNINKWRICSKIYVGIAEQQKVWKGEGWQHKRAAEQGGLSPHPPSICTGWAQSPNITLKAPQKTYCSCYSFNHTYIT